MATQPATLQPVPAVNTVRVALILLCCALLALAIPVVDHPAIYALAVAMALCVIVPAWFRWHQGRFDAFETVHLIGLRYWIFFGLGAIWAIEDPYEVAYDQYLVPYLPKAVLYCTLGYLALLAGYLGPWFRKRKTPPTEEFPRGVVFLLIPMGLGFLGSVADAVWANAFWSGTDISTVFSSLAQLAPLYWFAWGLGWLLVLSGRASRIQRWALFAGLIPTTLVIAYMSMTDKSLAMSLIGVPFIALWYARRSLPWRKLLVLVLLLIFVVFPFYNTYRRLDTRLPQTTRIGMTGQLISQWDSQEYMKHSLGTFKGRMSAISSVAVVLRDVGRWVPYARGETILLPSLAFFVPRAIWPEKPTFSMGRDFAVTFRVVGILDQTTRIAVTVPGELYWNYDLPGILFGMALWGLLLRLAYRRYGASRGLDPIKRAIHIVLLIQFVHFGGGLAAQSVMLIRTLLVLEVFCIVSRRLGLISGEPLRAIHPAND